MFFVGGAFAVSVGGLAHDDLDRPGVLAEGLRLGPFTEMLPGFFPRKCHFVPRCVRCLVSLTQPDRRRLVAWPVTTVMIYSLMLGVGSLLFSNLLGTSIGFAIVVVCIPILLRLGRTALADAVGG